MNEKRFFVSLSIPKERWDEARAWAECLGVDYRLQDGEVEEKKPLPEGRYQAVVFVRIGSDALPEKELLSDMVAAHIAAEVDLTAPNRSYLPDCTMVVGSPEATRNGRFCPNPEAPGDGTVLRHIPSLEVLRGSPVLGRDYARRPKGLHMAFAETCDMGCGMCPFFGSDHPLADREYYRSYRSRRKGREYVSPEMFKACLDEVRRHAPVSSVSVFGPGEPLQHPMAAELIAYCAGEGICLNFATNGKYLGEEILSAVGQAKIGTIVLSMDAATGETYRKVKPRGCPDTAERAVAHLVRLRDQGAGFRICLSFIRQSHNRDEEAAFVERWAGVADDVVVTSKYHRGRPESEPAWRPHALLPCAHLDDSMHVLTDGECWTCSAGVPDEFPLGNLLEKGFEEVRAAQDRLVSRRLRENEAGPLCRECRWWRQSVHREVWQSGRIIRLERPYSYRVPRKV